MRHPSDTRDIEPGVVSMLDQRHRRWSSIETTLGQCLVFTGIDMYSLNTLA